MADTTETDQIKSPNDVDIKTLTIITSDGQSFDIRNIFNGLNIYEDITSPVISGSIQIVDGMNFHSAMGLHGNEFLAIQFTRPGEKNVIYDKTFRIYKSSNRKPGKNQTQMYTLHFCSEELIFSNQQVISKRFKSDLISNYVKAILQVNLKTSMKKMDETNFENSAGVTDIYLTKSKPFEAIEQMTKVAFNANKSTFLFFENRDGYNFVSLEKLVKRGPIATLNFSNAKLSQEDPTDGKSDETPYDITQINDFKFDQNFNILDNTKSPTFAGRLYTLDILTQKYKRTDYNAKKLLSNTNIMMENNHIINDTKNRNQKTMFEEYDTNISYAMTNLDQTKNPYLASKIFRVNNTNIENTLVQRKMQLTMLNNTSLNVITPANPYLTVGYVVNLILPGFTPIPDAAQNVDPYHSGNYLITNVRHNITPSGGHQTLLRLVKNSVSASYDGFQYTDGFRKAQR
jgi:hypothetical protein